MKRQRQRTKQPAAKNLRSKWASKPKLVPPQTAEQFFAMSEVHQDLWIRIAGVVSEMRSKGISLASASREAGLDPRVVTRLARSSVRKQKNGRYVTKVRDHLLRVVNALTTEGRREVALRDSRLATQVGEHWDAAQRYLQKGDASALRKFRGVRITEANGNQVQLLTDLEELARLGNAGVLSFESMYARTA